MENNRSDKLDFIDKLESFTNEELDDEILNTENELNSFENPKEIASGFENNQPEVDKLYENIMKLPREERLKLLTSMGQNNNVGHMHDFGNISENTKKNAKEKLSEKLAIMKNKRISKFASKIYSEKVNHVEKLKKEQDDILSEVTQENMSLSDSETHSSESNNSNELNSKTKLSKSQKRRIREKKRKQKNAENMKWSDNEENNEENN